LRSHIDNVIELSDLYNADILTILKTARKISYCMETLF